MENKIRVGIITLVSSINYGTALQAYATEKIFEKMLGEKFSVEVLNVEIWNGRGNETIIIKAINTIKSTKAINIIRKLLKPRVSYLRTKMERLMREFVENDIKTSPKMFCPTYDESLSFLKSRNYDIYVSGSDEIWANKPGKPFPNIYFIPAHLKGIKISFASSANRGDIDALTETQKKALTASFESYDYISVRDENTRSFVLSFVNRPVSLIYDPTFLHDFSIIEFNNKSIAKAKKEQKKIICLMISNRRVAKEVIKNYGDDHLIVSIYQLQPKTCMLVPSPLEFATIFRQFDLVITNYFHGTVFSIKNDTPFISIDNEEIYKKYESKIANILRRLNLNDQYIAMWDNSPAEYSMLHDKIQKILSSDGSADYTKAREIIKTECEPEFERISDHITLYSKHIPVGEEVI